MTKGFLISMFLHGIILVVLAIDNLFPFSTDNQLISKPLPVNILTTSEFTRIKTGSTDAKESDAASGKKPEPEPEKKKINEKKPERKATLEATVKEEAPPEKPKPVEEKPIPVPEKKVTQKPKPEPEKKKEQAKPKPGNARKDKKDFSPDKIAALLNKLPSENVKQKQEKQDRNKTDEKSKGEEDGEDITMTINEIDAFVSQISQCWVTPIGGLGADRIVIRIRLTLNRDGSLSKAPEVMNSSSSPFFRTAQESALRAVLDCQPYKLPVSKYKLWREFHLNFDPRAMYGG